MLLHFSATMADAMAAESDHPAGRECELREDIANMRETEMAKESESKKTAAKLMTVSISTTRWWSLG